MRYNDISTNHILQRFLSVCRQELELEDLPAVYLVAQPDMSGPAFGEFDGTIRIVSDGRHIMDVLRTLAHELVHWKQCQMGEELDGADGSDTENQANAVAGIIMRRFGKSCPHLF